MRVSTNRIMFPFICSLKSFSYTQRISWAWWRDNFKSYWFLRVDTSDLPRSAYKTMKNSFPTDYIFTTSENHLNLVQNLILVETQDNKQLYKEESEFLSYQNTANKLLGDTIS